MVHVLGKLSVTFTDGREPITKFRTQKAALLLAYLALNLGKAHSREFLIELLWPDADPEASRHNLNTTLSILRHALGRQSLETDHATVRLSSESIRVDAQSFEALVHRGLNARLPECERRAALAEALALWDAPLLGFYDDWAIAEQARLEALRQQAFEAQEKLGEAPAEPEPTRIPPHTLPVTFSRYFGAPAQLAALTALLESARLVTLTGIGGIGKTRLSLELARNQASVFSQVVFLSLAELPKPSLLLPTLRRTLTGAPPQGDPLTEVIATLQKIPGRVLLVLDNLEHLLLGADDDEMEGEKSHLGVARVVRELLEECPNLVVLATSRQPLRVEAEQQYPVPLLQAATAVELFVDRARAVRPDFTAHPGNQAQLEAICTLLDGLPLAIELAAAWVHVLSLDELHKRLESELLWLEGRRRDLNPRQKSLEATLRWSWQLLDPAERRLLAALSVFRGGWTLEAAEAVSAAPNTLDALSQLIDKSLVMVHTTPQGTRYGFLETIRQFAQDRLEESGKQERTQERQLAYFLALAQDLEPLLTGREQAKSLSLLDEEHDNLRTVLEFSLSQPEHIATGQALAGALRHFWQVRGYLDEGRSWYIRLLEHEGGQARTSARAWALHGAGVLANIQADYPSAARYTEESREIHQERGDQKGCAVAFSGLGNIAFAQGDFLTATQHHEASLALKRVLGDEGGIAISLNNLGNVAHHQKNYVAAQRYHEESLAIKQRRGDENGIASSLLNLGNVAVSLGEFEQAREYFQLSLQIRQRLGDRSGIIAAVESLAGVAQRLGSHRLATTLFGAAADLHAKIGSQVILSVRSNHERRLTTLQEHLGKQEYEAAWSVGVALTPEEVVTLALAPPNEHKASPDDE